jgi:hypothetical protein
LMPYPTHFRQNGGNFPNSGRMNAHARPEINKSLTARKL